MDLGQSLLAPSNSQNGNPAEGQEQKSNLEAESVSNQRLDEPEDPGIKFKEWGFKIDRLFEVAYRFYKRNESKAFHPSFDIRNQMNALILQARYGNFDDGRAPDIGTLDLVGKSRRHQWSMLKGMSKTEAMSKFICTLDEICPLFKAYAEAIKISSGNQSKVIDSINENNGRDRSNSERSDQLKAIHTSLCRQTYNQFKSYAEKQYPSDSSKQKYLISSLQEQYYQQYISQMNPESRVSNNEIVADKASSGGGSLPSPSTSESSKASTTDSRQFQSLTVSSILANTNQVQSNLTLSQGPGEPLHNPEVSLKGIDQQQPSKPSTVISLSNDAPQKEVILTTDNKITEQSSPLSFDRDLELRQKENQNILDPLIEIPPKLKASNQLSDNSSNSEVLRSASQPQYQSLEQLDSIANFESFPEPTPIKKVADNGSKRLSMNFFNYLTSESGNKQPNHPQQQQQQQPATSSLYVNCYDSAQDTAIEPTQTSQLVTSTNENDATNQEKSKVSPDIVHTVVPEVMEVKPSIQTVEPPTPYESSNQIEQQHLQEKQPQAALVEPWDYASSSGSSSPLQQALTIYEPLEPATLWTKKGVSEFKDSLIDDEHGGAYIVKQATSLNIKVPTYSDGKYIYWEFVTDDYDIGFGLDFVYDNNLTKPLALEIYEETEDEDEEEDFGENQALNIEDLKSTDGCDKINGQRNLLLKKKADKLAQSLNTTTIVPTYRRDSHEEVFVGRHRYPGQGYYLLKFDNTYSVLRSKSLFFRICYFI